MLPRLLWGIAVCVTLFTTSERGVATLLEPLPIAVSSAGGDVRTFTRPYDIPYNELGLITLENAVA